MRTSVTIKVLIESNASHVYTFVWILLREQYESILYTYRVFRVVTGLGPCLYVLIVERAGPVFSLAVELL